MATRRPKHFGEAFDLMVRCPPVRINHNGVPIRRRGCAAHDDFWRGFDGIRGHGARSSMSHAAWLAGKRVREMGRDPLAEAWRQE